jgi:hypothetical protein
MTNASKHWFPRAAGFEALCALVTAACLIAHGLRWGHGPVGVVLASTWGLAVALVASRASMSSHRLWAALALANLAISGWTADATSLVALWLPSLTACTVRALDRRQTRESVPSIETAEPTIAPLPLDEHDRQHTIEWSQVHDRAGAKTVNGVARLSFKPGERQTELHLAFCPSFTAVPTFHVEQTGGSDVRVKVTQVMPYGARLEVQRTDASAWSVVGLEFTATLPVATTSTPEIRKAS